MPPAGAGDPSQIPLVTETVALAAKTVAPEITGSWETVGVADTNSEEAEERETLPCWLVAV